MGSFDHFLPNAACRGIHKLERKLAQVSKVRSALDYQDVTIVPFSPCAWLRNVVSLPCSHTVGYKVIVIMAAQDDVYTLLLSYGVNFLGRGRQCNWVFR